MDPWVNCLRCVWVLFALMLSSSVGTRATCTNTACNGSVTAIMMLA